MPDTGAPWNIPYVEPADLVRDYPAADEAQALAIAAGLSSATFSAGTAIVATDASWPVPTLANPIVKVTCVGGGGGGGGNNTQDAGTGGTTTFNAGAGVLTLSASGGAGGAAASSGSTLASAATLGLAAANGGRTANSTGGDKSCGSNGLGGEVRVTYMNLGSVSTVNVTIGAGGTGGTSNGSPGGRGEVIVEYVAG
jgi:hypothetical protein